MFRPAILIFHSALLLAHAGPSGPINWTNTVNVANGGWGRMIPLTNGSWLCVSTTFPAGTNSYLSISRSTDICRTWAPLSRVHEDGRTLDNGELIGLPNGHLLLTMRSLVEGISYRLPVYRSTNNGVSWTYLSNIDTSEGLGSLGLWEPDFWVLEDGRLVVTYSNEKHSSYSQIISGRVSTDNGATWGTEIWAVFQPGGGSLRPGMSQMARMKNGKYILVYEVVGLGNADVYYKTSENGVSWATGIGQRIPCQHCGPFVTSLPDGRLLVTSCENQVSFSEDFGETWQKIDPPAWNTGFRWTWPAVYGTRPDEVGVMAVSPTVRLRFGVLTQPIVWPNPFVENFNNATDLNWTRYGGNVDFADGRYALNNTNGYGKSLVGDGFWTDGLLEADIVLSTPGNAGLMFRTTNPDYTGPDDAFGYYAGLSTTGALILGKMDNAWHQLASAAMAVATNRSYHLKISFEGSTLKIWVDNQVGITWTDSSFPRGQVGVRSFNCNAQFDNFTFTNTAPLRLDLRRSSNQLQFSWPQTAFDLLLCRTSNLQPSAAWSPLTNIPALSNGMWSLSLPSPPDPRQFYRLQSP